MNEEFDRAVYEWELHDDWQFADREAERKHFFLAGQASRDERIRELEAESSRYKSMADKVEIGGESFQFAFLAEAEDKLAKAEAALESAQDANADILEKFLAAKAALAEAEEETTTVHQDMSRIIAELEDKLADSEKEIARLRPLGDFRYEGRRTAALAESEKRGMLRAAETIKLEAHNCCLDRETVLHLIKAITDEANKP